MTGTLSDALLTAIIQAERGQAGAVVDAWAVELGYESALTELLAPVLRELGERWARSGQEFSLAQGYVASKVAEDLFGKIMAAREGVPSPRPNSRGTVVLGNVEEDYHPMGRKMVASFLRLAGWDVCDLGVDVLPAAFVDAAVEHGARVIGASAMMFSTARNVPRLREEIERRGLGGRIQLAVGGAVFKLRPELVAELGGDGTAADALQSPGLIEDLWQRSCALFPEPLATA
jgi:methylmalonyl-CoA mutase cobalamin-binding domain/chain